MSPHVPPPPETLLVHSHFVRAIVRSLLRSADGEDDVVQQAMLRAWQGGPRQPGLLRPWLSRISRNLAIDHLRAARRRERHLRSAGAPPPAPSADEVLQREEQRQRVIRAVLALPQPYRDTLLLRYWEERSNAAIARRLGEPAATIRSRLKRGLQMLRERLDRDYGGRAQWSFALLPLAGAGQAAGAGAGAAAGAATFSGTGALLMAQTKLVATAAVLVAAGVLIWALLRDGGAPAPGQPGEAPAGLAPASGALAAAPAGVTVPAPEPEAGHRVEIGAAAALTVRGRTLDKGVPLAAVPVTLQWFDGLDTAGEPDSEHEVESDAEGRFVWRGPVREALASLRARTPRARAIVWSEVAVVEPGQEEVTLELSVMPLDRVLSGRVHDTDGEPIEEARLTVNGWPETATVTGSDGRYEIFVPSRGYPLLVGSDRHRARLLQSYMPDDAVRYELDIELEPGASFRGRVVDRTSAPVAGARVRASGVVMDDAVTDAEGTFRIGGVAPGSRHELSATLAGFRPGKVMATPDGEDVEIVLLPGLALPLRVIGPDGRPVVAARVRVVLRMGGGWLPRGLTGTDGRLRLEDLEPGAIDVIVDKPGFVRQRRRVDVGEAAAELVVPMRPGFPVAGRVVDGTGAPVHGASVYCRVGAGLDVSEVGTRDTSDVDGRFAIEDLPDSGFTLVVFHEDHRPAEIDGVVAGRSDIVVRLQSAPMVAGRVVDGATGRPVPKFTVQVAADHEVQALHMDPLVCDDADGVFRAQHPRMVAGAELFVEVRAEGYAPARIGSTARVDARPEDNVIALSAGTLVTGVLRDAKDGTPVAGALVVLEHGDPDADLHRFFARIVPLEQHAGRQRTGADGSFAFACVPAGENRLRIGHPDYPQATFGPFDVAAGTDRLEVQPVLSRGVAVRGRVTGLAGAAGLAVSAHRFPDPTVQAKVQPDHTFAFAGLGPGTYRLVLGDGSRHHRVDVEVADEDVEGIELLVRSGSGSVRVDVVGLDRGHAQVVGLPGADGRRGPAVGLRFEHAAFRVEGLPPGRYRVWVGAMGRAGSGAVEVDVGEGEVAVTVEYREGRR